MDQVDISVDSATIENVSNNIIDSNDIDYHNSDVDCNNDKTNNTSHWYPGKFLGITRRLSGTYSSNNTEESNNDNANENRDNDIDEKTIQDEAKKESMIVKTIRLIRSKFLERQLVGRIYIYRLSGVISTALVSDVTKEDIAQYLLDKVNNKDVNSILENDMMIQAELTGQYRRSLSMTDTILNSLERRSLSWQHADFAHNSMLTRGTTLGVSDPFVGFIGFSFTLELSATAHSLLASRRRYEASREIAKPPHSKKLEDSRGSIDTKNPEQLQQQGSVMKYGLSLFRSTSTSNSNKKLLSDDNNTSEKLNSE